MPEINREDIIKALEWCIQSEDCEYCEYNKGNIDVCSIRADALTLIKQLTEEKREIFEEIEEAYDDCIVIGTNDVGYLQVCKFEQKLANLKKKYIGE